MPANEKFSQSCDCAGRPQWVSPSKKVPGTETKAIPFDAGRST